MTEWTRLKGNLTSKKPLSVQCDKLHRLQTSTKHFDAIII